MTQSGIQYQRIVVATDLSEPAAKAVAEAVSIARRSAAELHVLYIDVIHHPGVEGFEHAELADHVHSLGQTSLDAAGRDLGVSYARMVTSVVRATSAAAGILDYAASKKADLIVLGTHGRGALVEMVLGSVAQQVVRDSPISVVVVGAARVASQSNGGKPVIVAPVDLAPESTEAMTRAAALAQDRGAQLVVVHAIAYGDAEQLTRTTPEQARQKARKQLEKFVSDAGLSVAPELAVEFGAADNVTFEIATRRNASLVVIAPSRHGVLKHLLLGNMVKRFIRGAPCPVLVTRAVAAQATAGM